MAGFEPATSRTRTERTSHAVLHPDIETVDDEQEQDYTGEWKSRQEAYSKRLDSQILQQSGRVLPQIRVPLFQHRLSG